MADNDDVTCQLTRDDCIKISKYMKWLEEKAEAGGYDIGGEYLKVEKSVDKVLDGIYK